MPNGQVHTITTIVLAGGLTWATWQAGQPVEMVLPLAGGCLTGLLISPDLDVDQGAITHHHARELGGCVLGLAWALIWRPYALLIPHRSPLSHAPILGTVLRLAYLALLIGVLPGLLGLAGLIHLPPIPPWWLWFVIGLMLSDTLHWVLDNTVRGSRRRR